MDGDVRAEPTVELSRSENEIRKYAIIAQTVRTEIFNPHKPVGISKTKKKKERRKQFNRYVASSARVHSLVKRHALVEKFREALVQLDEGRKDILEFKLKIAE